MPPIIPESYANINIGSNLALGFIVLIGLAIALSLIFLIVVAGIIAERIRRKREGYMPVSTNMIDKSRLPPEQLFGTVGHGRNNGAPTI
jgi:Cortical protein marker for cell polarity